MAAFIADSEGVSVSYNYVATLCCENGLKPHRRIPSRSRALPRIRPNTAAWCLVDSSRISSRYCPQWSFSALLSALGVRVADGLGAMVVGERGSSGDVTLSPGAATCGARGEISTRHCSRRGH